MDRTPTENVEWTSHHEEILIDWADKAKCYHWLHNRSQKKYHALNSWFTIPVIILSTATGTANLAQYRLTNDELKSYAPFVLGWNTDASHCAGCHLADGASFHVARFKWNLPAGLK